MDEQTDNRRADGRIAIRDVAS